ncbi:hypothetical protein CAEBREN_07481 [Caenorhabditis brenneri]|uniref:Uncharacterized protein n=1 Tax=Caenorhabditis brenneri TaxID=135651 RepID=G0MDF1_CAEBE|nr:hypothetical protein CAEBREN_07481 [Caenorhabditis brenneri]
MEANLRFQLSQRCPSIRGLEKRVPLHIEFLNLDEYQFKVNDTSYHLSIYQDYSNCKSIPFNLEMENACGGIQEDLSIYGEKLKRESLDMSPGDIKIESEFDEYADDDSKKDDEADENGLKCKLEELEQEMTRRNPLENGNPVDNLQVRENEPNREYSNSTSMEEVLSKDGSEQDEVVEDTLFSHGDGDSDETVPDSVDLNRKVQEDDEIVQDSYGMEDRSDESVVQDSLTERVTQGDQNLEKLEDVMPSENVENSLFEDLESQRSRSALSSLFQDSEPHPVDHQSPESPEPTSESSFLTLAHSEIVSEMTDEQLLMKIESVKFQLLSYQLKRENATPPWKHFLQLTISNSDDVVNVQRGSYNNKLSEVMKLIYDSMFGGRKLPILVHRLYMPDSSQAVRVLRLPEDLKLKVGQIHCQTDIDQILDGIEPIIDASSSPLKQVESEDFPLHPIATSARSLTISCVSQTGATTEYFLALQSKEFFLKYWDEYFDASDCIPIIQHWLEGGKEVGTCFQFAMKSVEIEVLMGIKKRFNGEKIGDRSIEIPMFGSKLLVSYEDGYADGYHDIMFKIEVF